MKRKVEEIKQLDISDIRQKIETSERELYNLRYQSQATRVEKPHRFKELRKEIARCKTVLKEKEMINVTK
jgi:large subunit ribosomal protein L29